MIKRNSTELFTLCLPLSHWKYLVESLGLSNRLIDRLSAEVKESVHIKKIKISLTADEAEEIRELCGDKLQQCGFDKKYNLTKEGHILEDLVDILFTG